MQSVSSAKQIFITLLLGSLLVLSFDTLASLVSLHLQIDYGSFSFGSSFIYAYIGFYCAKYGNLLWSTLGAGVIGLIDSTFGWYISWMIGPGRPDFEMTSAEILTAVIFVSLTAMPFGLIGGLIHRWLNRQVS